MTNKATKIVQISDVHLLADKEEELLGVPTDKSFDAVVELIKENEKELDLIILSGDLAQDGSDEAYKRTVIKLKSFGVPVYWIPGNHDDSRMMMKIFPLETMSNHKHIILKNWHFILLNSQIPEQVEGNLDTSQLNYLRHCLQVYPEHHAIIVMHHHPFKIGSKWLDQIGLKNADEFWQLVASYHHVHSVLCGHVHQESELKYGHINCYSLPSTCIQFKPKQEDFALDHVNPGYRWLQLFDDGSLKTGIRRTKNYIGKFEENVKGY